MIAFPSNPDIGDFHTYAKRTWVWNGNAWQSSNYRPDGAIVADTPPSNPENGWLWWDRVNAVLYTWTGTQWVYASHSIVSTTAPANPVNGLEWWNPTSSRLFIWNGTAWVEPNTNFPVGDPDIWNYVLQVEGIDGQPLETGVVAAYGNFITGLKTDGLWDAVKASCILAGARTLDAALIPLAGAAPTNVNFTAADYNRQTGLKGDAVSKHLKTNRFQNSDPVNSKHLYVYIGEVNTLVGTYIGNTFSSGQSHIISNLTSTSYRLNGSNLSPAHIPRIGGFGIARQDSVNLDILYNNAKTISSVTGGSTNSTDIYLHRGTGYSNAGISFYSIGEYVDLIALNNRVSTLIAEIQAAIP